MIKEQYCGLEEHYNLSSLCVFENCNYQQRLICKVCNSKEFHSHQQEDNHHLLDLELILKNQEPLKSQSFQYHQKITKIQDMLSQIQTCKTYINDLSKILKEYIKNYDNYIVNLFSFQIHLISKDHFFQVDKMKQIISEVNNFKEDVIQKQLIDIINNIKSILNDDSLKVEQGDKLKENQLLQLVSHQSIIQFAQISPNSQELLFGTYNKLYAYNIQQQSYQQICNINNNTEVFFISKDFQQFYFDYNGTLIIYNRNLNKFQQIQLQLGEMKFIMVLSKVLALAYHDYSSQLYVLNLKLKKKVFKFLYIEISDVLYIENQNLLIVAQPCGIDVIMLNSKFKQQKLNNYSYINNIQFDQQSQQLIVLETKGILTFWNLKSNGQFIKSQMEINISQIDIKFFTYNQKLQQFIVFTQSEIIFYSLQGQKLQKLKHSYDDLEYYNNFSNYSADFILFRTDVSISLLKLNYN